MRFVFFSIPRFYLYCNDDSSTKKTCVSFVLRWSQKIPFYLVLLSVFLAVLAKPAELGVNWTPLQLAFDITTKQTEKWICVNTGGGFSYLVVLFSHYWWRLTKQWHGNTKHVHLSGRAMSTDIRSCWPMCQETHSSSRTPRTKWFGWGFLFDEGGGAARPPLNS